MVGTTSPVSGTPNLAWARRSLRGVGLVAALIVVAQAGPAPGVSGLPLAMTICLTMSAVGWLLWMLGEIRPRLLPVGLGILAAGGGVLATLVPRLIGRLFGVLATAMAGDGLSFALATTVAVIAELALVISWAWVGSGTFGLFGAFLLFATGLYLGLVRAKIRSRADQAELLLAQTQRARAAEAVSAALAERGRIAREIHDVLAHALAALTMQLQAAQELLAAEPLPGDNPRLRTAIRCLDRAEHLAREGMAETRGAVLALRGDSPPLPDLLTALVRAHGDHTELTITGDPVPVQAGAALALYRSTQEALTNAGKHAPGTRVTVVLDFAADRTTVTVTNAAPEPDRARPLTDTGSGYGLAGLRERAELVGGTLDAGPHGEGWRVRVSIPH